MRTLQAEDVVSILEYFKDIEDPRSPVNRRHVLGDLIVICVLSVVAGADGPQAMGVWATAHAQWLKPYLQLPNGIPSHDTIGRLLALLKPQAFQKCFQAWIAALGEVDSHDSARDRELIAIDGKALRSSHDRRNSLGPLFLVSAWSVSRGVSLGQLATAEKSNEIAAIPELLETIDVGRAVVTIDAAGCQLAIAAKIIGGGGDYVLALKGNQETLHREVQTYFIEQLEHNFAETPARKHEEVVKGHGRVDTLTYYHMKVPARLTTAAKWKGLKSIGVAIRISERDGQESSEVRYYISSLKVGVQNFARCVRGHWAIENTLHWCLDVTFREDESRLRNRRAADNVAWLKRFAISLLKQQKDKESIAMRRRKAGWNTAYLARVVGLARS